MKKLTNIQNQKIIHGGYSDIRLWPCYMVYTGSILFLSPQIGTFFSMVIVSVPAFMIALNIAKKYPVVEYEKYSWAKNTSSPVVKTKKKTAKRRATLRPFIDIPLKFTSPVVD